MGNEKLLTANEICDYLNINIITLHRHEKNGLPYLCFGDKNSKRYLASEILNWMRQSKEKRKEAQDVAGV